MQVLYREGSTVKYGEINYPGGATNDKFYVIPYFSVIPTMSKFVNNYLYYSLGIT